MKKISSLFVLFGLFLSLMILMSMSGCEEIEPVALPPEISTNVSQNNIGEAILDWNTKYADVCLLQGELVPLVGIDTFLVKNDTILMFTVTGKGGTITKEVPIKANTSVLLPTLVLNVTPNDTLPPGGGTIQIICITENVDTLFCNGIKYYPSNGIVQIHVLLDHDSTFIFEAKGKGGTVQKDLFIKVEMPLLLPTIVLTVTPNDTLPIGGGVARIMCITENATAVSYNGKDFIPINGFLDFYVSVDHDSTFIFKAKNIGAEVIAQISIVVIPPIPPTAIELLLCAGPWKKVKSEWSYFMEGPWNNLDVWDCSQDDRWTFCLNHTGVFDRGNNLCGEENRISNFNWKLNGMVIELFYPTRTIQSISSDTLVVTFESIEINENGSTPIVVRNTFIHP